MTINSSRFHQPQKLRPQIVQVTPVQKILHQPLIVVELLNFSCHIQFQIHCVEMLVNHKKVIILRFILNFHVMIKK
jgi:hypothetical protein